MQIVKISSSYTTTELPEKFSNQIYFSENSELDGFTYRSSYSLKYVISGYEGYLVEGKEMMIRPQQHLLVSNTNEVTTLCADGKAMSVFIAPETLRDVYGILQARSIDQNLDQVDTVDHAPIFRSNVYTAENASTKELLLNLARYLQRSDLTGAYEIDPAIFFNFSESIIHDQRCHSSRLYRLNGPRISTIQEQYERLLVGHQFLSDNWNKSFSLNNTAMAAMLSPYHFHRLFRTCFSLTPYQYHLRIRMKKAMEILKQKDYSVAEVGDYLGYNDTNTFGRAFKKFYGFSPSYARNNK